MPRNKMSSWQKKKKYMREEPDCVDNVTAGFAGTVRGRDVIAADNV